jgi:RNA recognition motif-containing protein
MSEKICVEGLSRSITETSLRTLFSRYGTVIAVRIQVDAQGHSLGIAEVDMADYRESLLAIQGLHREEISGKRLLVFRLASAPLSEPPPGELQR